MAPIEPGTLYQFKLEYWLRLDPDGKTAHVGVPHHFWWDGKIGTAIVLQQTPFTPVNGLVTTITYLDEYDHVRKKDLRLDFDCEVLELNGKWNEDDNELTFDDKATTGWVARIDLSKRGLDKANLMDVDEFKKWEDAEMDKDEDA